MRLSSLSPGRTIELGIAAKLLPRTSVGEVFDTIAGYGLTCAEWDWTCVPGYFSLPMSGRLDMARSVARAASRAGVRICAVSATCNLIQSSVRDRSLQRLPALAETAAAVGSDLLILSTGQATDLRVSHPGNASRKVWIDVIAGLRRAGRVACRYGVRLAIRPDIASVMRDADSAARAFEELGVDGDRLSIALDAASLYRPSIDPRGYPEIVDDALARWGDRISAAYARDINRRGSQVPTGTGIVPFPRYVTALVQTPAISAAVRSGQPVPLIMHGLSEGEIPAAVSYVRELVETLDRDWQSRLLSEVALAYQEPQAAFQ